MGEIILSGYRWAPEPFSVLPLNGSSSGMRSIWSRASPGVFVAGHVRHGSVKRVAPAVGEGAMAVSLVHSYLATV